MRRLIACPKPTDAMIRGFCIGGGLAIAIARDRRIAGENARFGIPAARLGLGYAAQGMKKLMETWSARPSPKRPSSPPGISPPSRPGKWGLLNRVVANEALETVTRQYSTMIGDNAPMTIHALKHTVDESARGEMADLAACGRPVKASFDSQGCVEGRRAFMEKRRPVFQGA